MQNKTVIRTITLTAIVLAGTALADTERDFAQLLNDEWSARQADNPFLKDVIESEPPQPMTVAPSDYARRLDADRAFYARLQGIDRAGLSPSQQLNYDIFDFVLRYRIELAAFKPYRMPFVSSNGFFKGKVQ